MSSADIAADTRPSVSAAAAATRWQRFAVALFACINVASLGVFFAVFVGIVMFPPDPRTTVFGLVVGGFAFAVLVMGQFVYWSRLALRTFRARSS